MMTSVDWRIDAGNRGIHAQKTALRQLLRHQRATISPDLHHTTSWKAANHLRSLLMTMPNINQGAVIALYVPRHGEVDVLPLAADLRRAGFTLALPRVAYKGHGLAFNIWLESDVLERDEVGLPAATGAEVIPAVIVAPMLGYNRSGYRLGYGGGYYDRTFKNLLWPVLTVGMCHTELEIPQFPKEYADVRLDYVVTGKEVIVCR